MKQFYSIHLVMKNRYSIPLKNSDGNTVREFSYNEAMDYLKRFSSIILDSRHIVSVDIYLNTIYTTLVFGYVREKRNKCYSSSLYPDGSLIKPYYCFTKRFENEFNDKFEKGLIR